MAAATTIAASPSGPTHSRVVLAARSAVDAARTALAARATGARDATVASLAAIMSGDRNAIHPYLGLTNDNAKPVWVDATKWGVFA